MVSLPCAFATSQQCGLEEQEQEHRAQSTEAGNPEGMDACIHKNTKAEFVLGAKDACLHAVARVMHHKVTPTSRIPRDRITYVE